MRTRTDKTVPLPWMVAIDGATGVEVGRVEQIEVGEDGVMVAGEDFVVPKGAYVDFLEQPIAKWPAEEA